MSTPTKKRSTRKPSQTARILETVETLLAHQESQANQEATANPDVDQLINRLDSLEETLRNLNAHADEIRQEPTPAVNPDKLVEKISQQVIGKLLAHQESQAESAANANPDIDQLVDRLDSLEETLRNLKDLAQEAETRQAAPPTVDHQMLVEKISQQVTETLDDRLDRIEASVSKSSKADEANPTSFDWDAFQLTLIEEVEQKVDAGLSSIQELLENTNPTEQTNSDTDLAGCLDCVTENIESLKSTQIAQFEQLESMAKSLQKQVTQIETKVAFESREATSPDSQLLEQWQDQIVQWQEDLQQKLEDHFEKIQVSKESQGTSDALPDDVAQPELAPSDDGDTASHWEKQKAAMLQKYGIDPDHRPLEEEKARAEAKKAQVGAGKPKSTPAHKLDELHESIDNISPEDKEAIEKLKKDLNAKLRDAEVELSINRAKLSQERAELEQQRAELEQRMSSLQQKLDSRTEEDKSKSSGIMSRFTRHLGR